MTKLVLPIMFELKTHKGQVVPGPGTTFTLNEAARRAKDSDATVLFTASEVSSGKYRRVHMGQLCQDWFHQRWPYLTTVYEAAESFNTIGEIEAMARYVNQNRHIISVTVVVKSWHAPRVKMIVSRLQAAGQLQVPIQIIPHRYPWRINIWNLGWILREGVAYAYWYAKYHPQETCPPAIE